MSLGVPRPVEKIYPMAYCDTAFPCSADLRYLAVVIAELSLGRSVALVRRPAHVSNGLGIVFWQAVPLLIVPRQFILGFGIALVRRSLNRLEVKLGFLGRGVAGNTEKYQTGSHPSGGCKEDGGAFQQFHIERILEQSRGQASYSLVTRI